MLKRAQTAATASGSLPVGASLSLSGDSESRPPPARRRLWFVRVTATPSPAAAAADPGLRVTGRRRRSRGRPGPRSCAASPSPSLASYCHWQRQGPGNWPCAVLAGVPQTPRADHGGCLARGLATCDEPHRHAGQAQPALRSQCLTQWQPATVSGSYRGEFGSAQSNKARPIAANLNVTLT
jgi:hypothetical protein